MEKGGGDMRRMRQGQLPLSIDQDMVALPSMSRWEGLAAEYEVLGLSPGQQAMGVLRPSLKGFGELSTSAQVAALPDDTEVRLAGLVVCRQRPSTAKGLVFLSMEDEYGLANVVVYPQLLDRERRLILGEPFLIVRGRVQRQGTVVHIVAHGFERPDIHTDRLIRVSHDFH
jgi:error-prone DNA polymerase